MDTVRPIMTTSTAIDPVRSQAARWAERLMDSDLTVAERETFQLWLLADESHQREFRAHTFILNLTRDLPEDTRDELLAQARPGAPHKRLRSKVWIAGLAASALLALGLAGWFVDRQQAATTAHITTAAGMTRDVTLPDESVAHLNTRTEVRWVGRANERRVALLEGEALFEVRHGAAEPFTVIVDTSENKAVGLLFAGSNLATIFNPITAVLDSLNVNL